MWSLQKLLYRTNSAVSIDPFILGDHIGWLFAPKPPMTKSNLKLYSVCTKSSLPGHMPVDDQRSRCRMAKGCRHRVDLMSTCALRAKSGKPLCDFATFISACLQMSDFWEFFWLKRRHSMVVVFRQWDANELKLWRGSSGDFVLWFVFIMLSSFLLLWLSASMGYILWRKWRDKVVRFFSLRKDRGGCWLLQIPKIWWN